MTLVACSAATLDPVGRRPIVKYFASRLDGGSVALTAQLADTMISATAQRNATVMHAQPNEPCIGCGRSTGPGTRIFSDRRTTRDTSGTAYHLCGDCNERAISQYGRRLTDSDMVRIAARGAGLGMAHGHGGMTSGAGG